MLSKFMMRAAFAAAALSGTAGSASAEEYHILMMDYAFFPEINYVQPGDVVIFENMSGSTRDILGDNGSWFVTDIEDGSSAQLTIAEGMPNVFLSLVPGGSNDEVDENGNVSVIGRLNFSAAPVASSN